MLLKELALLCFFRVFLKCFGEPAVPEVTFEAYTPKGFRVSIPALSGIWIFAFHGNLNKEISREDSGEFGGNFMQPTDNNTWSYFNEDLHLKPGDSVHYWVLIHYEKVGYRIVDTWTVSELVNNVHINCESSTSIVDNKTLICAGNVILEDNFDGDKIDKSKWLVEQFIPSKSEDYEFVSYQNKTIICYIQDGKLYIKPKALQNESEVRGELDLSTGCTRSARDECYVRQIAYFILPPVSSGRIVSLVNFRYGRIEIKAKLPAGDWIYPQVYLEDTHDPTKKLWIAYSRGNIQLKTRDGVDIGARLLYGGPVLQSSGPRRVLYLRTIYNLNPFSNQMHTYTVIWQKDAISLQVDGREYGRIGKAEMSRIEFAENSLARLVLGVGVGGINDFPDDSAPGDSEKPWKNAEIKQMIKFFRARDQWSKSWSGDNVALQIENIKITAL